MIEEILKKSVYVEKYKDRKDNTSDRYIRFYCAIKDGNQIFPFRLVAKELSKQSNQFIVEDAGFYDFIKEKSPFVSARLLKTTNSPTAEQGLFSVRLADLLKDVKDEKGLNYVDANGNINYEFGALKLLGNNQSYNQSAFHGSPYDFPEFRLDEIGAGEGVQAHGWGLYFSKDNEVAEDYKNRLKYKNQTLTIDGKEYKIEDYVDSPLIYKVLWNIEVFGNIKAYNSQIEKLLKTEKETKYMMDLYKQNLKEDGANTTYFKEHYEEEKKHLKEIKELKKLYKKYSNSDKIDFIFNAPGTVYEVDIPENDVLLDEQKSFKDQPDKVKKAIREIIRDIKKNKIKGYFAKNKIEWLDKEQFRGWDFYDEISRVLGSQRTASELLNKYGIKGITYDGRTDGRCFVVFDDKAIEIINKYHQQNLGAISWDNAGRATISLFQNADQSTIIHEGGDYFFQAMYNDIQRGIANQNLI